MDRSTARLHYNIALSVLGNTTQASVISSIWRIQGAVAEQDTGASERFRHCIVCVKVGEIVTVLLILTYQPALLQTGDVVDNVQDVVLKHAVLQINRALCKHFSLASLGPGNNEKEEEEYTGDYHR